jgi:hypothetical protein
MAILRRIGGALIVIALAFVLVACDDTTPRRRSPSRTTGGLNATCFPGFEKRTISRDQHTCRAERSGVPRGGRVDRRPTCGTGYALSAGSKRYRGDRLVQYGCIRVGSTD